MDFRMVNLMANEEPLNILERGAEEWNLWRKENPDRWVSLRKIALTWPNLAGFDLHKVDLGGAVLLAANLTGVDLTGADLRGANLTQSNLTKAKLNKADMRNANFFSAVFNEAEIHTAYFGDANLEMASFVGADLRGTNMVGADLSKADFTGADLTGVIMWDARLVRTNFERANLTNCAVHGISAWGLNLEGATQSGIIITPPREEPKITVDNLAVAQFVYLLLTNQEIRNVIDTITSKVILILGRFTPERKLILDALREGLRKYDYLPIIFDFDKPASRDITETISTIAHMARFVIADITEAKSIPQELQAIVPNLPSVPVQPLLLASEEEYGMFEHFKKYPWVLETYFYSNIEELITHLEEKVINPPNLKARELHS